jgi:hypothetical protein
MLGGGKRGRMGTCRKLMITMLLAWVVVVGPLTTAAVGVTWVSSLYPASSSAKRSNNPVEASGLGGTADDSTGFEKPITIMGTALALLKPVAVILPTGDDGAAYVRESIVWQFDNDVCRRVVGLDHKVLGISPPNAIAACGSY